MFFPIPTTYLSQLYRTLTNKRCSLQWLQFVSLNIKWKLQVTFVVPIMLQKCLLEKCIQHYILKYISTIQHREYSWWIMKMKYNLVKMVWTFIVNYKSLINHICLITNCIRDNFVSIGLSVNMKISIGLPDLFRQQCILTIKMALVEYCCNM